MPMYSIRDDGHDVCQRSEEFQCSFQSVNVHLEVLCSWQADEPPPVPVAFKGFFERISAEDVADSKSRVVSNRQGRRYLRGCHGG